MSRLVYAVVATVLSVAMLSGADTAPPPSLLKPKAASFDPPEKLEPRGGFAIYTPDASVKAVEYIALDGEEPFPVSLIGGSPTSFVFFTRGLAPKNYRFVGVASDSGGNLTRKMFSVPVGGVPPGVPPPAKPPDTKPPEKPPVETPALYYFLIVREDGPASAAFTKTMQDPAWLALKKAGHKVGDHTVTQAATYGFTRPSILPCVITLLEDDKKSKIVREEIALPSTSPAILDLPKGVVK